MTEKYQTRVIVEWISLVEASRRLHHLNGKGLGYAVTYDYMIRGVLVGRKMRWKGGRKGWYVTEKSVLALQAKLNEVQRAMY